jgi:hypothetical protein
MRSVLTDDINPEMTRTEAQERFEAMAVYLSPFPDETGADDGWTPGDLLCARHERSGSDAAGSEWIGNEWLDVLAQRQQMLAREVMVGEGTNTLRPKATNRKGTVAQLLASCEVADPERHTKEGTWHLQGAVNKSEEDARQAAAMATMETVRFDVDNGQSPEEIEAAARRAQIECVIHPSFNDGKPETRAETDKVRTWANKQRGRWPQLGMHDEATGEQVRAYLAEFKGYLPWIMETAKFVGRDKLEYVVEHAPLRRFRILLPLTARVELAAVSPTLAGVKERWANFYLSLAKRIGIKHVDESCKDLSRLFYLHRRPKGVASWSIRVRGLPVTFTVEPANENVQPDNGDAVEAGAPFRDAAHRAGVTESSDGYRTDWMPRFVAATWKNFEAGRYVADHVPGAQQGDEKASAPCIFTAEHNTPDAAGATTMYAYDASTSSAGIAVVGCNHTHCDRKGPLYIEAVALSLNHTAEDLLEYVNDDAVKEAYRSGRAGSKQEDVIEGPAELRDGEYVVDGLILINACDVVQKNIKWLIEGWVPMSMSTVMAGPTKVGKSQLACHMVARVTRGEPFGLSTDALEDWRKESPEKREGGREPIDVLYLSGEDGETEVAAMLDAAGADMRRVKILTGLEVVEGGKKRGRKRLKLDDNMRKVVSVLKAYPNTKLVILDPLNAFLPADVDAHKNTKVRAAIANIDDIAKRHDIGVVITHHNKKGRADGNASDMVGGSNAVVETMRSVVMMHKDPTDDSEFAPKGGRFGLGKSGRYIVEVTDANHAISGQRLGYVMEGCLSNKGTKTKCVDILAERPTIGVLEAMSGAKVSTKTEARGREVVEFLLTQFAEDKWTGATTSAPAVLLAEIDKAAAAAGFNPRTLRRWKRDLGIISDPTGMKNKPEDYRMWWKLPAPDALAKNIRKALPNLRQGTNPIIDQFMDWGEED